MPSRLKMDKSPPTGNVAHFGRNGINIFGEFSDHIGADCTNIDDFCHIWRINRAERNSVGITGPAPMCILASALALSRETPCLASTLAPSRETLCLASALAPSRETLCLASALATRGEAARLASVLRQTADAHYA